MTRFVRLTAIALGLCLGVATLLGARSLLGHADDGKTPPGAGGAGADSGGSVTVLGVVTTDPPESAVGPPALAGMLTVEKVLVAPGQQVQAGQELVLFDDRLVVPKVKQAEGLLAAARQLAAQAQLKAAVLHPLEVEGQQLRVTALTRQLQFGEATFAAQQRKFDRLLGTPQIGLGGGGAVQRTEAERAQERAENVELREAESKLLGARDTLAGEQLKLRGLQQAPVQQELLAALGKVTQAEGALEEARAAVEACRLRARQAGQVEQIFATPGMTFGPATRVPALYLIPAGKRFVRAEVEAEFVMRIDHRVGKAVTVTDATAFAHKYPGVVREIGGGLFVKRAQADGLVLNPVRVLECMVELTGAPAGAPELKVGQPVRVSFH